MRWWHRYKVQGFLVIADGSLHPTYYPKYFITHRHALNFQAQLYQDHGPGQINVVLEKIKGKYLRTEVG